MMADKIAFSAGPASPPQTPTAESAEDYGPDWVKTPDKPPKINIKNPPKPSPLSRLGTNKKARSPVRKLTGEDVELLARRYRGLGKMAKPFHPKFSVAMEQQSDECAESWLKLAETNDTVRRWILAFIEGGAWTGVIVAHTPIFLAVIPEATLNNIFLKGMGLFTRQAQEENSETELPLNGAYMPTWGSKSAADD